jgi:ADP-ribose pyrophosphatase YjhB (NUDIX family)
MNKQINTIFFNKLIVKYKNSLENTNMTLPGGFVFNDSFTHNAVREMQEEISLNQEEIIRKQIIAEHQSLSDMIEDKPINQEKKKTNYKV